MCVVAYLHYLLWEHYKSLEDNKDGCPWMHIALGVILFLLFLYLGHLVYNNMLSLLDLSLDWVSHLIGASLKKILGYFLKTGAYPEPDNRGPQGPYHREDPRDPNPSGAGPGGPNTGGDGNGGDSEDEKRRKKRKLPEDRPEIVESPEPESDSEDEPSQKKKKPAKTSKKVVETNLFKYLIQEEKKEKARASLAKHRQTDKAKKTREAYNKLDERKEAKKIYNKSDEKKESNKKYSQTDKAKASREKSRLKRIQEKEDKEKKEKENKEKKK